MIAGHRPPPAMATLPCPSARWRASVFVCPRHANVPVGGDMSIPNNPPSGANAESADRPDPYAIVPAFDRALCDPRMVEVIDFMKANLDRKITSADLGALAVLSSEYFTHRFTADIKVSPMEYLRRLRMERAMELVRTTRLSMKEITGRVGYNSPSLFSQHFKRYYGEPPSEFRKRALAERIMKASSSEKS